MNLGTESKVFCTCHYPAFEAFGLVKAGLTKEGGIQFVHSCGRPFEGAWRGWLEPCEACWGLFSSPWSTVCLTCHKEERRARPYKGWSWARSLETPGSHTSRFT